MFIWNIYYCKEVIRLKFKNNILSERQSGKSKFDNKIWKSFEKRNFFPSFSHPRNIYRSIYISQEYVNIKWFPSTIIDFHIVKISHVQEREPRGKCSDRWEKSPRRKHVDDLKSLDEHFA